MLKLIEVGKILNWEDSTMLRQQLAIIRIDVDAWGITNVLKFICSQFHVHISFLCKDRSHFLKIYIFEKLATSCQLVTFPLLFLKKNEKQLKIFLRPLACDYVKFLLVKADHIQNVFHNPK